MTGAEHNRFINRELSWLEFNQRVLDEALDPENPLLERLKFFCIVASNLDEFFEVRVAGVKQQAESGAGTRGPDGLTPAETLRGITRRVRQMVDEQYRCWREELAPDLARNGIRFLEIDELDDPVRDWMERFYRAEVRPVLTPLCIDPAHPVPLLLNKSLNLIVQVQIGEGDKRKSRLAVVQVPQNLPRLVKLPREDSQQDYVFLGRIIGSHLADLFPGSQIHGHWLFRVTRNSELYIDEEEAENLLKAVEVELRNRRKGQAVRLEVQAGCPEPVVSELLDTLDITEEDLYFVDGPLRPTSLMAILGGDHPPELRDPPFLAPRVAVLRGQESIFETIRRQDVLLHHPYESFESVVAFLQQAAIDPDVLAIKQTLYRTGGDERIVGALMDAVTNGKQVTAVVELRARFDEKNNIEWSRKLEEAGVHVVYGLVGYKIHSKVTLVVRRDPDGIRRYLHLGTGNYNPTTARLYTDLSLLTCRPAFGEDATDLFNLITGICQFPGMSNLLVAPFDLHKRMMACIRREAENARRGLPARIVAKMNSLVEVKIIDALYEASEAGVEVDLIVRGTCCLRPGLKGLSENIRVRSIVGRFLEHSRIFYFENACQPEVFVGSADWMPRNFFRRIEVVFPIEDGKLRERIVTEILGGQLRDDIKARLLLEDGTYVKAPATRATPRHNSQAEFVSLALQQGVEKTGPRSQGSRNPGLQVRSRPDTP